MPRVRPLVAQKAQAALARGVTPIVCVGETLEQREAGETDSSSSGSCRR
jgi:triosephosphate isomerase